MAPIQNTKTSPPAKQQAKLPALVDDDDKWTDILEKEEAQETKKDDNKETESKESDKCQNTPIATAPPLPTSYLYPLPGLVPPFGSPQHGLEAELMQLAEIDLGLVQAIDILERKVIDGRQKSSPTTLELNHTASLPPSFGKPVQLRCLMSNAERSQLAQLLRDTSYMIGLKRAVKILKEAVEDEDRKEIMFTIKELPAALLPQTYSIPAPLSVVPYNQNREEDIRKAAREIAKDVLKEVKGEFAPHKGDEVQQEMIKLCRDVCRDALSVAKKD